MTGGEERAEGFVVGFVLGVAWSILLYIVVRIFPDAIAIFY